MRHAEREAGERIKSLLRKLLLTKAERERERRGRRSEERRSESLKVLEDTAVSYYITFRRSLVSLLEAFNLSAVSGSFREHFSCQSFGKRLFDKIHNFWGRGSCSLSLSVCVSSHLVFISRTHSCNWVSMNHSSFLQNWCSLKAMLQRLKEAIRRRGYMFWRENGRNDAWMRWCWTCRTERGGGDP